MASTGQINLIPAAVSGEPQTQEQANQVILEIQGRRGYLSRETLEHLRQVPTRYQEEILHKFAALRRDAAKLVLSATELNSSDVHFVHEILQNADDARYNYLRPADHPWVRFKVTNDTIVIETNEDGFTRADIDAICETGESSKKRRDEADHIGEKGIGFKSVFRVAESVRIDSNLWHFHFDYADGSDGADGLGMVTPLLDDPIQLPSDVGTRMTLHLNTRYRRSYARIVKELEEMPETTIFFLRNILEVKIEVEIPSTMKTTTTIRKNNTNRGNFKRLTRSITSNQKTNTSTTHYEVYQGPRLDMPKDPRRPIQEASVQLAFPVDETSSKAMLDQRGQYVFAYLPLYRNAELRFLIQSDFITTASRESTADCDWNDILLDATADAFCNAIVQFCKSSKLLFEWPRYLPTLPIDGLFGSLRVLILKKLVSRPIFATWTIDKLKTAAALRVVPSQFLHKGEPLLNDLPGSNIYLNKEYSRHLDLLRELGAQDLGWNDVLDRLSRDLSSVLSLVRSGIRTPTSEWHEKLAAFFLPVYTRSALTNLRKVLDRLTLIPLLDGKWVASPRIKRHGTLPVIFSTINGVAIPHDVGYDLVDVTKATNPTRWQLLNYMGVQECASQSVVQSIFKRHESISPLSSRCLIDHLYFLYRFPPTISHGKPIFWVTTSQSSVVRSDTDVYLRSERPYSSNQLLQKMISATKLIQPPADTHLLHPSYSDVRYQVRPGTLVSFQQWLGETIGLCEFPALTRKTNSDVKLSPILSYVLSFSSRMFLSTLKARWHEEYGLECLHNEAAKAELCTCKVLCHNGTWLPLSNTYLPTESIINSEERLGLSKSHNILDLDLEDGLFSLNDWSFLTEVGVRSAVDVSFYVDALSFMSGEKICDKAVLAYNFIGANTNKNQMESLIACFSTRSLIYDSSSPIEDRWKTMRECVWEGPPVLTVKRQISTQYESNENAKHFFVNILKIPNATYKDIIEQLRALRSTEESVKKLELAGELSVFASENLIYTEGGWVHPDICLWSAAVSISGRPVLAPLYPLLEVFFTRTLNVQKASIITVLTELIRKAKLTEGLTIAEAKAFIIQISEMLSHGSQDSNPTQRLFDELAGTCRFLPVKIKGQQPRLVRRLDDFVIRDHQEYSTVFADQAPFLDFTFEEVPQLSAFIEATSINDCYLSELVEERSRVGDDAVLHKSLTNEMRQKAYSLFCCAYKFNSKRLANKSRTLLDELLNISVFTSSTITTELVLQVGKLGFNGSSIASQMHFKDSQLFLPEEEKSRRSCFRSKVPDAILKLMELEDNKGVLNDVTQLLTNPLIDVEDVMRERNIPPIPWISSPNTNSLFLDQGDDKNVPRQATSSPSQISIIPRPAARASSNTFSLTYSDSSENDSDSEEHIEQQTLEASAQTTPPNAGQTQFTFGSGSQFVFRPSTSRTAQHQALTSSISSPTPAPAFGIPLQDTYRKLIDQIIRVAASQHDLTQNPQAAFNRSTFSTILPTSFTTETTFGPQGIHRDFKIGAAGELFVFERLTHLNLPNFSTDNWQSRIRDRLNLHPKYTDLTPWPSPETADIVYKDTSGALMEWLQTQSFEVQHSPPRSLFTFDADRHPRNLAYRKHPFHGPVVRDVEFYIEVKATTASWSDHKFYMSRNEYGLMKAMHEECEGATRGVGAPESGPESWSQPPKRIYVVVRVYNLMSEGVGMKVFVDPLRFGMPIGDEDALLRFEPDSWIVYPTAR